MPPQSMTASIYWWRQRGAKGAGVAGRSCCLAERSVPRYSEAAGTAGQAPLRTPSPSAPTYPDTLPSLRLLVVLLFTTL